MRSASLSLTAFLAAALLAATAAQAPKEQPDPGTLPTGADGKPLNLDFETGTLLHSRAEGDAFNGQPVKGDTVASRRGDMQSNHQGQFWVGTYEAKGDAPQGTLTSAPFKVTHAYASFLVGGGAHAETRVELVRADTGKDFFRASGENSENMRRVVVDLQPHRDQEIFLRLVDRRGDGWGHINFDDFRFHREKPSFPSRPAGPAPADVYPHAGLKPEEAAKAMKLPDGFRVSVFAAEPDVRQPIAMCFDDRGRLWVAEAYSYPVRRKDSEAKDRILIFEDADGDGKFDRRTVFTEGLNLVSGLEIGFGGVWVGTAPYLMFIPDRDGDDRPDGPPEILLDGWGYQDTHETLNTFLWGPDGWLYGCHGVFTHSKVGKPGTPDRLRERINAGVWRYHPTKRVFEVFAHGTSNPWGLDFNDHGHAFCTACVIPHLFHIVQGGRYHRQAGQHFNPFTYDDIKTMADHVHWVGGTPHSGNNRSDSAGGGHAHCGAMIYLGGAWPEQYRGQIFMNNIHGQRVNTDLLRPRGSGYVGLHGPDFLLTQDRWSQILNFRYGPDGQVYLIDWYDRQACHDNNTKVHDRSNGRIFKVSYKETKSDQVDLQKLKSEGLVKLQLHFNDWYVRHARRVLQERGPNAEVHQALTQIAFEHPDETRRLRGLWALHVTGGLTDELAQKALTDKHAAVRGWAMQLLTEEKKPTAAAQPKFAELARNDPSPAVRLSLASALQRMPLEQRWEILEALVAHGEDASDQNLPLMYWYAAEPLAEVDPGRALSLAAGSKIPLLMNFMARRVAALDKPQAMDAVVTVLQKTADDQARLSLLRGVGESLKGQRKAKMPTGWPDAFRQLAASANAEVRERATSLAVTFGDPQALATVRLVLTDRKASLPARQAALSTLLTARDRDLAPTLHSLLEEPELRRAALRGLASYDHADTPTVLLKAYATFTTEEKRDALNTLSARPSTARTLLEAVGRKQVPATDLTADLIRQLRNLNDAAIEKQIGEVWGTVRETAADKAKLVAQYKKLLTDAKLPRPDPSLGRATFAKTCQQCHTLFGSGGQVGPELTGSNRADLDYLLSNILDPSAVMAKEYQTTVATLADGRVLSGIVRQDGPRSVTVLTANETITVPSQEIESLKQSDKSMMPDDLLTGLKDAEVRALAAYLASPMQVPLAATTENAKDFFNGRDLTLWEGDAKVWKVENGELVGRAIGLKGAATLRSELLVSDFRLTFQVKFVGKSERAGVLFRAEPLGNGDLRGYHVGLGGAVWGLLTEEHGRGTLKMLAPALRTAPEWNRYEIVAEGGRLRTLLNGTPLFHLDDEAGSRRGVIGLVLPRGESEVYFRDLRLELTGAKQVP